jgi:S-formylglutathione hydrolase FrmB
VIKMGGSLLTNMKNTALHSSIKRYFGKEAKEAWREADAAVVVKKLAANDKRGTEIYHWLIIVGGHVTT